MIQHDGTFTFIKETRIVARGDAADGSDKLIDLLAAAMGYKLKISRKVPRNGNAVQLELEYSLKEKLGAEGYNLTVKSSLITVSASDV